MSTVENWLRENRDKIVCNACGNCCRGVTGPCKQLLTDGRCRIHPSIVGNDIREEVEPNCAPDTDPVEVMLDIGYFCGPVADAIEAMTGERLEPAEVIYSRMGIRNPSPKIFTDQRKLNILLSREL